MRAVESSTACAVEQWVYFGKHSTHSDSPGTTNLMITSAWFRQLDLAPFDLLIWPHPAGESSSSMEPPSGLVGTVESVLCFPSRCGNPRCERISISGVSFHRPPFSFFFAPFFFLCACPQFSTEKYRARIA